MLTALYYPHVKMSDGLVKNSLFLWDHIEYIAPHDHFEEPWYQDPHIRDAVKLIATQRVPSPKEKDQVDAAIVDLLSLPLPNWFYVKDIPDGLRYNFYPRKLSEETWEKLQRTHLAEPVSDGYNTSAPLGLTIMSLLADVCAGTQRRLITDEASSYSALDRYLTTIGGGELGKFDDESERLVTISLKVMNFQRVSTQRLIELRQKEKSDPRLRDLRHKYLRTIEEYAEKLAEAPTPQDVAGIERVFEQKMKDDLKLLADELKDEAKKVFFSKEIATAIVAIAGSFVEPVVGLVIAGGALYKKKVDYRVARNKTLQGHPMSWLYSTRKFPVY